MGTLTHCSAYYLI